MKVFVLFKTIVSEALEFLDDLVARGSGHVFRQISKYTTMCGIILVSYLMGMGILHILFDKAPIDPKLFGGWFAGIASFTWPLARVEKGLLQGDREQKFVRLILNTLLLAMAIFVAAIAVQYGYNALIELKDVKAPSVAWTVKCWFLFRVDYRIPMKIAIGLLSLHSYLVIVAFYRLFWFTMPVNVRRAYHRVVSLGLLWDFNRGLTYDPSEEAVVGQPIPSRISSSVQNPR